MTLLCSTLLVVAGYAGSITTDWHHAQDLSGVFVEVQTCKAGFGLRAAASTEWVQVGPQFGYTVFGSQDWSVTLQAHGGLGYSNTHHPQTGIRQVTKWNGGLAVVVGYDRVHVKLGYDHMSNGRGVDPTNAGQDFWSVGVGLTF